MDAGDTRTDRGHQASPEDATGRKLLPTLYLSPQGWGWDYHIPDPSLIGPNGYLISVEITVLPQRLNVVRYQFDFRNYHSM